MFIDIGNSMIKIYYQDKKYNIKPQQIDLSDIKEKIIISSVNQNNLNYLKLNNNYHLISNQDFYLLKNKKTLQIHELGTDRFLNDLGALKKYNEDLIIFNLGTMLTCDIIENKTLTTGFIMPGINSLKSAMINDAELLNKIKYQKINNEISDTTSHINDGIYYAIIGFMKVICESFKPQKVIITGGGLTTLLEMNTKKNIIKELKKDLIFEDYNSIDNITKEGFLAIKKELGE